MSSNSSSTLRLSTNDGHASTKVEPSAALRSASTPEPREENPLAHIHPSVFSTPRTYKAASCSGVTAIGENGQAQRVNKETHKRVDQAIKAEMEDATIELEGIIEASLPNEAIGFDPAELLQHLSRKRNRKYKDGKWIGFEDTKVFPSEPRIMDYFEKIVKKVERAITKKTGAKRLRYYSDAFYNTPVKDDDCDRKPDGVLTGMRITKKDKKDKNLPTYVAIDGILEMKPELRYASEGHEQLSGCARLIFKNQPNRRKVFGVLLVGDEMTFCVFDRSGKVTSPSFNIHEKPELFLRVIVGLCYIDRETLGVDQTINLEGPKENWTVEVKGKKYPIQKVVYTEGVIRGRGTACYEVRLESGKSALVKDSWVDMSRDEGEVDTLKSFANIDHSQYVPKVVEDEVVKFGGKEDTTAKIRESLLKKVTKDGKVTWEWIDEKYKRIELRRHERILLSPFGMRLEYFRSLEELLNAIKHIALVIWDMQKEDGLHRDISLRNVLLQDVEGRFEGLLIDYDYAVKNSRAESNAVGNRTGTVPFMAIEVLKSAHKIRHAFYHDLESLVYVLCWICTTQGGPSNTLRCFDYSKSEIRNWNGEGEDTMRTVGNSKFSVMTDEDEFKDRVASKFDPYFTPIIPCILRLRELLFSGVGTNVDLVQTLMRKNPEDKSIKLLLPVSHQDPNTICQSFVEILEQGVDTLPDEHRAIPWMGLASTECSDADLRPVIDINKVADLRGVENEGPKETLARETDEESKSPCSIKGRPSTRASGFVEPAPKASRGTKRTLDMDMGEPEAPPTGSSKRLKLIEHQGPASIGLRRSARTAQSASAASQGPFDQSSSNSSLPKTPRDRSSILIPPVRIGETTSQDSVGEVSK